MPPPPRAHPPADPRVRAFLDDLAAAVVRQIVAEIREGSPKGAADSARGQVEEAPSSGSVK